MSETQTTSSPQHIAVPTNQAPRQAAASPTFHSAAYPPPASPGISPPQAALGGSDFRGSSPGCVVRTETCFEITRYVFYIFDFVFGVMMWGFVSDKLDNDELELWGGVTQGRCYILGPDYSPRYRDAESSPLCAIAIAIGVINMLLLLGMIAWHSLRFFNKPSLPLVLEAIAFSVMTVIWLALAIVFVTVPDSYAVETYSEIKATIAFGFIAAFAHLGSALVAFIQAGCCGFRRAVKTFTLPVTIPAGETVRQQNDGQTTCQMGQAPQQVLPVQPMVYAVQPFVQTTEPVAETGAVATQQVS